MNLGFLSNMETLIVILLAIIAYQLYEINRNRKNESLANKDDKQTTLNPVFSQQEIDNQKIELNRLLGQHSKAWDKFLLEEETEIRNHTNKGGGGTDFYPSDNLTDSYISSLEASTNVANHRKYLEAMIEANIATLNGTSIEKAREIASKKWPHFLLSSITRIGKDDKRQAITRDRKPHWDSQFADITSSKS